MGRGRFIGYLRNLKIGEAFPGFCLENVILRQNAKE
jgi:hypothetical protein